MTFARKISDREKEHHFSQHQEEIKDWIDKQKAASKIYFGSSPDLG